MVMLTGNGLDPGLEQPTRDRHMGFFKDLDQAGCHGPWRVERIVNVLLFLE